MSTRWTPTTAHLFPIGGGGPDDPPAPADPPAPPAPAPADPPAPPPPAAGGEPPTGWDGQPWDPDRARSLIEKQRSENKGLQEQMKALKVQNEGVLKTIGQALGLEVGDPDPVKALQDLQAQAAAQVAAKDAEIRTLRLGGALSQVLAQNGAHPSLGDYLKGIGALGDLDPTVDGFEKQLASVVKKSLETNPHFKTVQGSSRSGGEFPGGSGGPQETITPEMLKTMAPEEVVAARKAGKLRHLGIAPDQFSGSRAT